jgi:transglutaminase-like putative cysteine protease
MNRKTLFFILHPSSVEELAVQLERWFRLLNHATLGLASLCLVYAEGPFLPGVHLLMVPVAVLLLLAWWTEGRWVLPAWGANVLALLILLGGAAWLEMLLLDPGSWIHQVPFPAGLVPPMGPVLMALLLVKVYRPRTPADFWLLQGMGLLQVALGCVLATGPEFGGLLAAYLAGGLGCLAAHYLAASRAAPGQPWAVAGGRPARGFLPGFVLRWTALVGGLALVVFLLTPRMEGPGWEPEARFGGTSAPRTQTGFHEDINLLQTGTVDLSNDVAWTVQVTDEAGFPKTDLSPEQRWRGGLVDTYDKGVWTAEYQLPRPRIGLPVQAQLPDFGPEQIVFTFTLTPRQAGGAFVADPIHYGPRNHRLPVLHLSPAERPIRKPLFLERAGTLQLAGHLTRQEYVYRQVMPPPPNADRAPASHLAQSYIERLTKPGPPGVAEWTVALLRRLAANPRYRLEGALPDDPAGAAGSLAPAGDPLRGFVLDPDQWERVARALTDYLAHGHEFTYTLDLLRHDTTIDPTLDFLINLKQGHCERYASALTLMLRSVGIPARIVKGFRGVEHQGAGVYRVRQSSAHSWVEALMPGRGEDGLDWLALDPTPDESAPPAPLLARWWDVGLRGGQQFWRSLILDYNADDQADLMARLGAGGPGGTPVFAILAAGVVVIALMTAFLLWRFRRRLASGLSALLSRAAGRPPQQATFYQRLLQLLERHARLMALPGQTPREFATTAGEVLRRHAATAGLADLPRRLADVWYRVRFGDEVIGEEERQALDARLDELEAALRQGGVNFPGPSALLKT